MPLQIIAGPAGSGKSQIIADEIRPGWVLVDFTNFYVALSGVVRGPDGRYPPRLAGDPLIPIVAAVREFALQQAVRREIPGFVTTASFSEVSRLESWSGRWRGSLIQGKTWCGLVWPVRAVFHRNVRPRLHGGMGGNDGRRN